MLPHDSFCDTHYPAKQAAVVADEIHHDARVHVAVAAGVAAACYTGPSRHFPIPVTKWWADGYPPSNQ